MVRFPFDNSYARLPERFFARTAPTPVSAPRLIRLNKPLALQLGLDPDWLAAVTTGEKVIREEMLPGAVLTRVASSHIRVGTFQYFASRRDTEGVRLLADHAIARHYPDAALAAQPYRALLDAVINAQAGL